MLASAAAAQAATMDVLVVYDSGAKSQLGGEPSTVARSWVNQINGYYTNSKIDIKLNLVGTQYHYESGNSVTDLITNLQKDSSIRSKRDSLGADFVVMMSSKANCGIGYVTMSSQYAYSVVGPKCGPMTMAHELGHNMGLDHSRKQGKTSGSRYSYALGYGVDYSFATIMSYAHLYGSSRIGKFSNPNVSCNGKPCGVPAGKWNEADAARALQNVRNELSNYRASKSSSSTTTTTAPKPTTTTSSGSSSSSSSITSGKTYRLRAKNSGKCIDVSGNASYSGATIAQWSCHGGSNQAWTASATSGGYFTLKAKHSGKCLAVDGTGDRARAIQENCNGGSKQEWKLTADGSHFRVSNKASSKNLDIRGQSRDNRAAVQQYSANGGDNQRFGLEGV
ncbi:RICIN domain-containing protein [Allohahella marinimesophila]